MTQEYSTLAHGDVGIVRTLSAQKGTGRNAGLIDSVASVSPSYSELAELTRAAQAGSIIATCHACMWVAPKILCRGWLDDTAASRGYRVPIRRNAVCSFKAPPAPTSVPWTGR